MEKERSTIHDEDITINDSFFNRFEKEEDKVRVKELFEAFRTEIYDMDAEKNVLDDGEIENSNTKINKYFDRAIRDLNSGTPITKYTMLTFPDTGLLIDGAVVFYLISNGILQLRNQLDYNDSGLSIGLFNKTGQFQGWAQFLLQGYMQAKLEFKRGEGARRINAGFAGIGSEFGYYSGWDGVW